MRTFAIAGVQMHVHAGHDNLDAMRQRLDLLMTRFSWVQMVVFSELAPFGPSPAHAQPLPGDAEERFREWAMRHHIWLVPGSLFEHYDGHTFNTAPVISPHGEVVGRYRKMFPFRPYETGVSAGDQFLVFDVPGVARFGVSICYDMWFPETTRSMVAQGAEVILHPTLTDTLDRDVELSIARASAVTNQCYFFDINGLGGGGNGRSIILGPAGDVIHQAGQGEEIMPVHVYLDRVRHEREIGLNGLGQPLKSFRDHNIQFPVYQEPGGSDYLRSLGPLHPPQRSSPSGDGDTGHYLESGG
ncbi:MAG: carbon-nitrogen hydrolase family protein [Halofilum sp. (in: g-proteobacteria)]|nr:carbon-nitrogen hydrolase family protein [Halofilum sp. (in: g-proteobacteria)]